MKRILKLDDYWHFTPNTNDFKNFGSNLLLNRLLSLYTLKDNKPEMVHLFQISEAATRNNYSINFDKLICEAIQKIPEDCWEKIKRELCLYSG
ncbi:MAG: hypothetical protein KBD37_05740 [Burkholderiales bacterium]|nr:hypothetical protein [Burkholderiales bacterium]